MIARAALASVLAIVLASCSERALTQLVVVVDTDLAIPTQIDAIEIEIVAPDAGIQRVTGALAGEDALALPVTLGVVHRGGPLGPVDVTARALRGGSQVVKRRAQVFMVEGETLVLEVHLERACVGVACDEEQTCARGECRAVLVDRGELRPHDGTLPRLPPSDGGECLGAELCNGVDDDCDGTSDEGLDRASDPLNCGECGVVCPTYAGAVPACAEGRCTIACTEGRGDCDGEIRTGCETPLDSLTMCHECGRECRVDHGTPTCFGAVCDVLECAPGFGDCDGAVENGCEQRLDDLAHCGSCGVICARANGIATCAGGVCRLAACAGDWGNCDADEANGCEQRLDAASDCGACDVACPAPAKGVATCANGRCGAACEPGWGDCNGMASDGCETPLDSLADCGACGRACALAHASASCAAGACEIAACDVGWGDCDRVDASGCEESLETSAHCGSCGVSCTGAAPLCTVIGGARTCRAACAPTETRCGSECAALATSLEHCGACGRACAPAHATGECVAGTCSIVRCDPGWADCNDLASDGCETPLDTLEDCGGCGVRCALAGASASCAAGRCTIASCDAGRGDCDGVVANGCETALDSLEHCGACGVACELANGTERCAAGICRLETCEAGWGDCDGIALTGCERRVDTISDCGACGASCDLLHASDRCERGSCAIASCDPEWGDCDAVAANGCEQSLRTTSHCGTCGAACQPLTGATVSCAAGTCEMTCLALRGDCSAAAPGCEAALDTLMNCGACGAQCRVGNNATPTCAGGVCAIASCSPRRADCNGSIEDGCETRLDEDENNCGGCGVRCSARQRCREGQCR